MCIYYWKKNRFIRKTKNHKCNSVRMTKSMQAHNGFGQNIRKLLNTKDLKLNKLEDGKVFQNTCFGWGINSNFF